MVQIHWRQCVPKAVPKVSVSACHPHRLLWTQVSPAHLCQLDLSYPGWTSQTPPSNGFTFNDLNSVGKLPHMGAVQSAHCGQKHMVKCLGTFSSFVASFLARTTEHSGHWVHWKGTQWQLRFFSWIPNSFLHISWKLYACLTAVSKALCCQEQLIVSLRSCSCVAVAKVCWCLYCLHYLLPLASLCWYCISSAFVVLSHLVFWNPLVILCNPL